MLKPYWSDEIKSWNIIDTETKEVHFLYDDKLDKSACQDFCDLQNVLDKPTWMPTNGF